MATRWSAVLPLLVLLVCSGCMRRGGNVRFAAVGRFVAGTLALAADIERAEAQARAARELRRAEAASESATASASVSASEPASASASAPASAPEGLTASMPQHPAPISAFQPGAARRVLNDADLSRCRARGLPRGYLHAALTFSPAGRVERVAIDSSPALSPEAAQCVAERVGAVAVVPFAGESSVTERSGSFVP